MRYVLNIETFVEHLITFATTARSRATEVEIFGRWSCLVEQFRPVGTAFQTEYLLTLLNRVEARPRPERLSCYQMAWWIAHDLLNDEVSVPSLLRDAARVTRTFDNLGKDKAGLEHFGDLLETSEILMRTLVSFTNEHRDVAIAKFWATMLKRYAHVRRTYPGLVSDGQMGN